MKILFYNPATTQKRYIAYEAIKGSAFFRRPNYDAMRLQYLSKDHDYYYYDERIEEKPDYTPHLVVVNVPLNLSRYIESTIRRMFPGPTKIVGYGFYPTLFPTRMKKACDSVVIGDIANIWKTILADAQRKKLERRATKAVRDLGWVDTEKAMAQITGPVVATTLVLLAVFVPTAMLGGITYCKSSGRLFFDRGELIARIDELGFLDELHAGGIRP